MINRIEKLIKGGFFHILGSTFVNKCIAFITNIFLVRIFTKSEYGIFTGAFNVYYIVFLFSGLGIISGILFFCSKNIDRSKKNAYYRFSLFFGLISEAVLSGTLVVFGLVGKVGIEETRKYIYLLSLLPFLAFIFDYYSIILRAEKDNRKYSILLNCNSIFYALFGVLGAYFWGISGSIIGRYIAYFISSIIGHFFCQRYIDFKMAGRLVNDNIIDILKYSIKAGVTSALNVILYRIDVMIIALVVADAAILAAYKTGASLPENANFIPQAMMVYFLPLFIEHASDRVWIKRHVKSIYLSMAGVSSFIGIILFIFAKPIVILLWGAKYLDAIPCMRILTVSFVVLSTFRITSTNILLAFKRAGYTLIVSLVSGIVNIILDVYMTVHYGSIGAAYATLIVTILAALLSFPYVLYLVKWSNEKLE